MEVRSKGDGGASQTLRAVLGIRDLVYSGAVAPGERLSEITMTERLGLSRTPVRAALARLEQEGILEPIPTGGYAVRSFTEADIVDAIELRGAMEGVAARLAAERGISDDQAAALESILTALDGIVGDNPAALDFQGYEALNGAFHDMLRRLAGSAVIEREVARIAALPFAGPSAFLDVQTEMPDFRASLTVAQAQHRAIAEAIGRRQGARAEALAREHALLARRNLEYVMENGKLRQRVPALMLVKD